MANINISEVHLLNVPLENDYKHTLYFGETDNGSQHNYFYSKKLFSCSDFTYQRKDHIIRVPYHYDDLYEVNYVMYKNKDKWFYAFVTEVEYVNEGTSYLHIETDVLQTWYYDYTVLPSFVEREHVSDDTVGKHIQPEGLETGEFIVNNEFQYRIFEDCEPVVAVTQLPGGNDGEKQVFNRYNGLFQGCAFIAGGEEGTLGMFGGVDNIIKHYIDNGKESAIQSIFMAPKTLTEGTIITKASWKDTITFKEVTQTSKPYGMSLLPREKPTKLDGYTPRNKKLLTFPYCYLNLDTNAGSCGQYRYEDFELSTYEFGYEYSLVPGISSKIFPNNYQNTVNNYHHAMSCSKLPICSWSSDVYTNWLTQNSVNNNLSIATGIAQMVGGIALGIGTGGIGLAAGGSLAVSGLSRVTGTMVQMHQQSYTPPTLEGNLNTGDVNYGLGLHNPMIYEMSIKSEYAKVIDSYFDMFGYKVNCIKVPQSNHRPKYWYTKTIDVNIDGKLPQTDLEKIKKCYNTGITFWKNPSEIQNYSVAKDNTV